ncbi:hypothetical protein M6D81_00955 [Paenibacillus sp. J5C_2022]|uniref:hypothetical protein n=1 Tax=Paenibacillus sp. J5C2022 TaxID=2977129 RepID=UPI0021CEDDF3|nr:hypothetical protein [Paenibacillus sp. J5C2022]MCU6707262.1 hypothetical protein [Paenibacillus sp. J5C2022]
MNRECIVNFILMLMIVLLGACSMTTSGSSDPEEKVETVAETESVEDSVSAMGNEQTAGNERWIFASEEHLQIHWPYMAMPLLVNEPQDRDYAAALEALVDDSAAPMSKEEIEKIKADPNASMVDNVLPDGRYLQDNWVELQNKMVEATIAIRTTEGTSIGNPLIGRRFERTVATGNRDAVIKLQEIEIDGGLMIIPQNPNQLPGEFIISPDGMQSYLAVDNALYTINSDDKQLRRLSSDTYNGKTYEQLNELSLKQSPHSGLVWNAGIIWNQDYTKLIYHSNKHNPNDTNGMALFAYDIESGTEELIEYTPGADYMIKGWTAAGSMICTKVIDGSRLTTVIVTMDGEEFDVKLEGDAKQLYDTRDGHIAYATHEGNGVTFHIAKLNEVGQSQEITSIPLEGGYRQQGPEGFSPDHKYFSILYAPDDKSSKREVKVVDLDTNEIIDIRTFPENVPSSANVTTVSWLRNDALLIILSVDDPDGVMQLSTWIYSLSKESD